MRLSQGVQCICRACARLCEDMQGREKGSEGGRVFQRVGVGVYEGGRVLESIRMVHAEDKPHHTKAKP